MAREGPLDPWTGQRAAFPLDADPTDADHQRVIEYLRGVRAEAQSLALGSISRKRSLSPAHTIEGRLRPPVDQRSALDYGDDETASSSERNSPDWAPAKLITLVAGIYSEAMRNDRIEASSPEVPAGDETSVASAGAVAELSRRSPQRLSIYYRHASSQFALLEPQVPAECKSQAAWKEYVHERSPMPLSHTDTFRLYVYLARWLAAEASAAPVAEPAAAPETAAPMEQSQARTTLGHREPYLAWAWSLLLRTPPVLEAREMALVRDVTRAVAAYASSSELAQAFVQVVASELGQTDMLDLVQ